MDWLLDEMGNMLIIFLVIVVVIAFFGAISPMVDISSTDPLHGTWEGFKEAVASALILLTLALGGGGIALKALNKSSF